MHPFLEHLPQFGIQLVEHFVLPNFLAFCVVFCRLLFVILSLFLFTIELSALLWLTDSDYAFGIFKYFQAILNQLIHIVY